MLVVAEALAMSAGSRAWWRRSVSPIRGELAFLEAAGRLLAVPGGAGVEAMDVHLSIHGVMPGLAAGLLVRLS